MSNTLYITVGEFKAYNQFGDDGQTVVLAGDSYGNDTLTFDDVEHLKTVYPTKEDLIRAVLGLPTFEGAAILYDDGTYELDSVGSVIVEGYPE